ncbi:SDR family NAD(P)-dependent oxidoreductase [Sporofaciens sp. SGI.106]|uniref:SDR family NAD(P)-dependent oxidoreductase n=1 Tax=Sporofaciens sp. SGI.106 TaxID=3420568 RepID=UPI002A9C6320|nr:SDR family NAD(P)-dependent oxidoreductase [Lachnoclostridium sp.]
MRIAIVTGASSGIGKEFARQIVRCYRELDELWLIARSTEKLQNLKTELEAGKNINIRIYDCDLQREYLYYRLQKDMAKSEPDIRMLVNAAGFGGIGRADEMDVDFQCNMVDVNCQALTRMTLLCLPYMSKGSRLVNVASAAAFAPQPGFVVYAATKSYVYSFSRALGEELREKGIIVTAVCPGPVDTPFFEIAGTTKNPAKKASLAKPEAVVRQALCDSRNQKPVSVYGWQMKGAGALARILPKRWIMRIMRSLNE